MANETINFTRGAPSADLLPHELVAEAAAKALKEDWKRALVYGLGRGHVGLCEWIAEKHGVDPKQVMVANGSLEAGAMLFNHLVDPGTEVIVEQPTYDRTLLMLNQLQADLIGVELESDGLSIDALKAGIDGRSPKLAHVIPTFQNPAGCTLSAEKRQQLVDLAAERDFLIFEDDPYAEVYFGDAPPATMLSLDNADKVVYASSFSKTVTPGIRVGYLVGPVEIIDALAKRANETYISPNMLAGSIIWEMATSGLLERNIKTVQDALRERRDALVAAIEKHIPGAEFVAPDGGYFLWLTFPDGANARELNKLATEAGAPFIPGDDFMIEGGESSARLAFSGVPAEQMDEGISRIADALGRL